MWTGLIPVSPSPKSQARYQNSHLLGHQSLSLLNHLPLFPWSQAHQQQHNIMSDSKVTKTAILMVLVTGLVNSDWSIELIYNDFGINPSHYSTLKWGNRCLGNLRAGLLSRFCICGLVARTGMLPELAVRSARGRVADGEEHIFFEACIEVKLKKKLSEMQFFACILIWPPGMTYAMWIWPPRSREVTGGQNTEVTGGQNCYLRSYLNENT